MFKQSLLAMGLALSLSLAPAGAATKKADAKPLPSKNVAISETVTLLEKAKKTLQADTHQDTNMHKTKALQDITSAMQELRKITQGKKH